MAKVLINNSYMNKKTCRSSSNIRKRQPKPSVIKIHQQLIIKVGKGRLHGEHVTTKCTQKGCSKVIKYARKKGEVECFPSHNII